MDDVGDLIAALVADDVDGVLWDWDDVAGAAAATAMTGNLVMLGVSRALWRRVERGLSASRTVHRALYDSPLASRCVGARKEHVQALARAVQVEAAGRRTAKSDMVDAIGARTSAVGAWCPLPASAALSALQLRWRWICYSVATKAYGLSREQLDRHCASAGAQYGGTRFLLRDVRAVARRLIADGASSVVAATTRKTLDAHSALAAQQAVNDRLCEERAARERELAAAMHAAGLPTEMARSSDARRFVQEGEDSGIELARLITRMRACADSAADSGVMMDWSAVVWSFSNLEQATRQGIRQTQLRSALQQRGLTLRRDSRVCQQYVAGERDDLEQVVEIMAEMKWYYECTDYPGLLERAPRRRWWDERSDSEDDEDEPPFDPVAASHRAKVAALRRMGAVPVTAPANVCHLAAEMGVPFAI